MNLPDAELPEPWHQDWPAEGLEAVDECPVCKCTARRLLHDGLVDNTFRNSPGRWTMWLCTDCASGYLSPRPTRAAIHAAYDTYYTHNAANSDAGATPLLQLRRRLANGYMNWRYGSHLEPASRWGVAVALLLPSRRAAADCELRHLPRRPAAGGSLLDVGCGDGAYLRRALNCGWNVLGLEPDSKAAKLAKRSGATVIEGGLEQLDGCSETFDAITLNHVIEHMHEPSLILRSCLRLLKPGGQLWIQTPNVAATGHGVFGMNWRGLEAPRHLVLLSAKGLDRALQGAGFAPSEALSAPNPRRWIFERSMAIAMGRWPDTQVTLPATLRRELRRADLREVFRVDQSEFLTVRAVRPMGGGAA